MSDQAGTIVIGFLLFLFAMFGITYWYHYEMESLYVGCAIAQRPVSRNGCVP